MGNTPSSAGKGSKRRKEDEAKVRANWPFPDRKTSAQWCEELALFPVGPMPETRMTESEFRAALVKVEFMHRTTEPEAPQIGA